MYIVFHLYKVVNQGNRPVAYLILYYFGVVHKPKNTGNGAL